jgi:hypothetical protein
MSIVCVRSFAVSLDGFAAGLDQSLEQPLGARGPELMEWFFSTRYEKNVEDPDGDVLMFCGHVATGCWRG